MEPENGHTRVCTAVRLRMQERPQHANLRRDCNDKREICRVLRARPADFEGTGNGGPAFWRRGPSDSTIGLITSLEGLYIIRLVRQQPMSLNLTAGGMRGGLCARGARIMGAAA
jgi:hypothetical protein